MIRKLAFALSLLSVLVAESVFALGIGEATVQSALNQPLKAEIELVNTGELSAEEILPGLATREEFLRANVDRVYFLSDLRFEVQTNEKGKLVVVLTTNKPVREPFLNFLVEVIWPSGRLLREYALLIDPPLFSEEPVAAVKASSVSGRQQSSGDTLNMPQPAAPTRQSVANPSTGGAGSIAGGEYGPTASNDTLWDIAIKARPNRSVSPQQVMLAIQDLNPDAFIQGNINKLKAGQVLRLPSLEQIKQRSSHQAIEEVIAQNETARGKRTKSVASNKSKASSSNAAPARSSKGDELKLVVAQQNSEAASSANSGTSSSGNGSGKENDPKLAITLEKLDKANIENQELNSRVTDLEEQLQTLQRLLTLKNDQLANIQTQMRANELEKAKAEQAQADSAEPMMAEEVSAESAGDLKAGIPVNEAKTQMPAQEVADAGITEPAKAEPAKAEPAEPTQVAQPAASPVAPVVNDSQTLPKTERNIIEVIISDTVYLAITILLVIVVVVVLWLVSRNNAKKEEEFQALHGDEQADEYDELDDEDLADEEDLEGGLSQNTLEESVVDGLSAEDEHEFLDDDIFPEDADSSEPVDTAEEEGEDVIAEADVYIAYGRLDQAVAVLETAISEQPVRTDLRLKLLEVYKQGGDSEAFNRQYSELEAIQDPEAIEQANVIRGDMLDEQLVSIEDKEHALEQNRELEAIEEAQREAESAIETEVEALDESQSFDFDSVELDEDEDLGLGAELGEDLSEELGAELGEGLAADLSETDLGLDDAINEVADEIASSEDFDDSILDVDLDDIDLSGELDQETEIQLPSDLTDSALVESLSEGIESDPVDVSLDTEEPVISDDILEQAAEKLEESEALDEGLGDAGEFDFLEGTDEASTKLDLARAYIDMGDIEGAKDILEEVAKEGNADQQAEATDLLSSLG